MKFPDNYFIREIALKNRSMLELDEALNLYYHLLYAAQREGDVVELGCYRGLTGVLMQKTLKLLESTKKLFLYDSFQGLPEKGEKDLLTTAASKVVLQDNRRLGAGWFSTSIESVYASFDTFGVELPIIVPGWFSDTLPEHLPEKICFAHVDGDFFSSVYESLEGIYPHMVEGGIVLIDDYCDPKIHEKQNAYPGVKRACDAFLEGKEETIHILPSRNGYQGYFIKKKH